MDIKALIARAEQDCVPVFARLEENELFCTNQVLSAFHEENVAARHFAPTTGYGYDDIGRDTLERIFARIFGAESAIVRPSIACGTAALSLCLFGLLLPGDHLLSATGAPYDTMETVIGTVGNAPGNLREMKVEYSQVEMCDNQQKIDVDGVLAAIRPNTKVVLIQRSRGYAWRASLLPKDMKEMIFAVHQVRPDIFVMVDNCYGMFTTENEPTHFGADVCVGSLIKNAGGGLAPTGAYLVGTARAIERIEARLTAPGIGREVGSYAASYQPFYQGLFMAPHTVAQALKSAILAARTFELLGMKTTPAFDAPRADIIQAIQMETPERLIAFCQGIQAASPIDASAVPEPWDMPGYTDQVIMAAGTFVSGATTELSADAPIRAPFTAYLQGGLTYIHGKIALISALEKMVQENSL
ncbi:MAG: methionine gamma-lyase family protein [Clostridia bacterium]|nr:methionine gamma-lyase family protein [Clostridia bacterium]